nr:accessory gene regulator B family protein [uncultured Acetatifactor sp.]
MLYQKSIIDKDSMELCAYGIQITMANLFNFMIAFGIGLVTDSLMEIALFYTVFISLRFFCGGYHAKSYRGCFSLFAGTCLLYLIMQKTILEYGKHDALLLAGASIFLGVCIFVMAPIENENRPFAEEERSRFRIRSIWLYLIWVAVGTILHANQAIHLSAGFTCVFVIISIYMLMEGRGKIEEKSA